MCVLCVLRLHYSIRIHYTHYVKHFEILRPKIDTNLKVYTEVTRYYKRYIQ